MGLKRFSNSNESLIGERGDFLIVFMKHAGDVDDMIFADEMDAKVHSTK